jgi:glutaredoxin
LPGEGADSVKLVLFHSDSCPHCTDEKAWLETIKPKYPALVIEEYEIGSEDNTAFFKKMCEEYNTTTSSLVPKTFVGGKVFVGFSSSQGDLVYNQAYRAYTGYANQIEASIAEALGNASPAVESRVLDISKNTLPVQSLIQRDPDCIANYVLVNGTYIVGWWSRERVASKLYYPDVAVYIDAVNGGILKTETPTSPVPGLDKPVQGVTWIHIVVFTAILLYLCAFLFLRHRLKWGARYWVTGFLGLVIISAFILAMITPEQMIERFANGFPFPVFVFIIALADGFNPCAFTVLIVLLSLLTHTHSRKKMMLVGGIFIITSAFMYFLFIMIIVFAGSWAFSQYGSTVLRTIGALIIVAGIINVKDFFFFKKGISLGISDGNRSRIFRRAGKIVKGVDQAENKKALFLALMGTVFLATLVNIVELGCTAMLPAAYMSALFNRYGNSVGFLHAAYTLFYSIVYVIPLFAILADFLYSFRSDRLTENQARFLKLFGGIFMLVFGVILILKPGLLVFA